MTDTRYRSSLTDAEWKQIEPLLQRQRSPQGQKSHHGYRKILDGVLYVLRTGAQWRELPHEWPPWSTVYGQFWRWCRRQVWPPINAILREELRRELGREPQPSAGSIDSQSVKTTEAGGPRGYDAGKKLNGRKRHVAVDTLGLLLHVVVHAANVQDRDGARLLLTRMRGQFHRLQLLWADGGYRGQLEDWVREVCGWTLAIVDRPPDQHTFTVLPRRWVVERTFGWLGRCRRLAKDYERDPLLGESFIYLAMIKLMLRRLTSTA